MRLPQSSKFQRSRPPSLHQICTGLVVDLFAVVAVVVALLRLSSVVVVVAGLRLSSVVAASVVVVAVVLLHPLSDFFCLIYL